jgi:hypothetical protein
VPGLSVDGEHDRLLVHDRPRRRARLAVDPPPLKRRHPPDARHAHGHQVHAELREAAEVLALVARLERVPDGCRPAVVDRATRRRDAQLVALPDVAAVSLPLELDPILAEPRTRQMVPDGLLELRVGLRQLAGVHRREVLPRGCGALVAHIGGQQPGGSGHPRVRGHDHVRDPDRPGDLHRVERTRSAGGHQREVAGVIALADRVGLDRVDHVVDGDRHHAQRCVLDRQPERLGHRG